MTELTLPHKVPVLRKHITNGIQENCNECVVALAIRDSIPGIDKEDKVSVQMDLVYIKHKCYALPNEVQGFIKDFDKDAEVNEWQLASHNDRVAMGLEDPTVRFEPFEFEITSRLPSFDHLDVHCDQGVVL